MSNIVKAIDYSSRDYWERRFNSEESFEWLQPLSNIVPFVRAEFEVHVFTFLMKSDHSDLISLMTETSSS